MERHSCGLCISEPDVLILVQELDERPVHYCARCFELRFPSLAQTLVDYLTKYCGVKPKGE